VAGLALLTTLKSLRSLWVSSILLEICVEVRDRVMTWIQNVATSENGQAGSNLLHTHWLSMNRLLEAITAFYVQMFFCRRLWVRVPDPW
jgi:hypothetical protein